MVVVAHHPDVSDELGAAASAADPFAHDLENQRPRVGRWRSLGEVEDALSMGTAPAVPFESLMHEAYREHWVPHSQSVIYDAP